MEEMSGKLTTLSVVDPWLLSVAVIWGLNAVAVKWLLSYLSPLSFLTFRFIGCSVLLGGASALWPRAHHSTNRFPHATLVILGLLLAASNLIYTYALALTTASEATLIYSTVPIWAAILGLALHSEVLTPTNWAGVVAAAGGVALIVAGAPLANAIISSRVWGDVLMVTAAILYAALMAASKGMLTRHGTLPTLAWMYTIGTMALLPFGVSEFGTVDLSMLPLKSYAVLFFSIVLAGGYGSARWFRAVLETGATRTAVYQYLVPVVGVGAALLLLGERLSLCQYAGSAAVLLGIALARLPKSRLVQGPPTQ